MWVSREDWEYVKERADAVDKLFNLIGEEFDIDGANLRQGPYRLRDAVSIRIKSELVHDRLVTVSDVVKTLLEALQMALKWEQGKPAKIVLDCPK